MSPYFKQTGTRKNIILSGIGILIASILYIPIPQLIGLATNILSEKSDPNKFIFYIIALTGLYIIRYFILVNSKASLSKVEKRIISSVKLDMIKKHLNLPLVEIQKEAKGNVMGRFEETNQLSSVFSSGFTGTILNFFEFCFSLIMIAKINRTVFIYLIFIAPIYYLITKKLTTGINRATKDLFTTSNAVTGKVFECVNGVEEIKKVNAKNFIIDSIKNANETFLSSAYKQNKTIHTFTENIQCMYNLVTTSILALSGGLIFYGNMEFAQYLILSGYTMKTVSFLQGASSLDIIVQPAVAAVDRIKEYLSLLEENEANSKKVKKISSVEFRNVSYRYDSTDRKVLDNFNLKIKEGDQLLIKGPIGSGKSTILRLLMGLYEVNSGKIYINDILLNEIDKELLREQIGIVSQDVVLFNGTIAENIILDNKNISIEKIENTLKELELTYLLDQFENGLRTTVSLNSQGVSGGQAKIIALLRAICTKKDLIMLDESTSNLDPKVKSQIIKAFQENQIANMLIVISLENSWDYINNKLILS